MQPKKHTAISIGEAAEQSPVLSRLRSLIEVSQVCLDAVSVRLPVSLRKQVSPGPIEVDTWCIFAHNSAVAGKLRQLKPDLEQSLAQTETGVRHIRIKVMSINR